MSDYWLGVLHGSSGLVIIALMVLLFLIQVSLDNDEDL